MSDWHSLFIRTGDSDLDTVISAFHETLTAHGYQPYDPFPGGTGTPPAFKTFVRVFITPIHNGMARMIGAIDLDAISSLGNRWPLLSGSLDADGGSWQTAQAGSWTANASALGVFLKPGAAIDRLQAFQAGNFPKIVNSGGSSAMDSIPLPPNIQQMAEKRGVDPRQADRLLGKMTGQVFGRMDKDTGGEASGMQSQARAMLQGDEALWQSTAGQQMIAIASLLTLPDRWQTPKWADLREAYNVARLLARNPKARLLPGDQAALNAVPDAIRYTPLYFGRP